MCFQSTQYYPQDSDLLIYPSCQMCFLSWRVQIARQQILWSFTTLNTRGKDLQDLCKLNLNLETVNLSIALILHSRLAEPKAIVAEELKLWRSNVYDFRSTVVGYIQLTKLCGFLNMPPPMTSDHMMAYLIR